MRLKPSFWRAMKLPCICKPPCKLFGRLGDNPPGQTPSRSGKHSLLWRFELAEWSRHCHAFTDDECRNLGLFLEKILLAYPDAPSRMSKLITLPFSPLTGQSQLQL
jgi:hypothetical protein